MKTKTSEALKRLRTERAIPGKRAVTPARKHQRISAPAKPAGDTIKVLISLPASLNRQLDRNASKHGISKSALVRNLIVKNSARVGKP
jgi:hypothetical protein